MLSSAKKVIEFMFFIFLIVELSYCYGNDCRNLILNFPQEINKDDVKRVEIYFIKADNNLSCENSDYLFERIKNGNFDFSVKKSTNDFNIDKSGDNPSSGNFLIFALGRDDLCNINWIGCVMSKLPDSCGENEELLITMINNPNVISCYENEICRDVKCMSCIDNDEDLYGEGEGCLGSDCNDNDQNNWSSCESCKDNDVDNFYSNCDNYVTIQQDCYDFSTLCTTECIDSNADQYYDCNFCGAAPRSISNYYINGFATDVYVSENYAYIAEESKGLSIIDISNINSPQEVGFFETLDQTVALVVQDNNVFLASKSKGLRIIDVSDKTSPQKIGYYITQGDAVGLDIYENYIYLVDQQNGLRIIDISDLTSPVEVGFYNTGVATNNNVLFNNDYAFLSCGENGVKIIDVYDVYEPFEANTIPDITANSVSISSSVSDYMFVAGLDEGLTIYDINELRNPNQLWHFDLNAVDIADARTYLYVSDSRQGLVIIDFDKNGSILFPSLIGSIGVTNGSPNGLFEKDQFIFVTYQHENNSGKHEGGMQIFSIFCE